MKINFTAEDKQKIERFKKEYMVGVLADEYDEYFVENGYDVIKSRQDIENIDFYIKPLVAELDTVEEKINKNLRTKDFYIGQSMNNEATFQLDKIYFLDEKEESIRQQLEGKLILFKPLIKIKEDQFNPGEYKIFKNLIVEEIIKDKKVEDSYLKVIEIFENNFDFEKKIISGEGIEFENVFAINPEIILCKDYLYDFGEAHWERDGNIFKLKPNSKVYKKVLNHEIDRFIKTPNKNLLFVEEGIICDEDFRRNYIELNLESMEKEEVNGDNHSAINKTLIEKKFLDINILKEETAEVKFLNNLISHSINKDLYYKESDLINFHICLKTNYLTILAGMSGTGKSKLTRLYSDLLNKSSNDKLLFIPVSPSYNEPGDILGFYNPNTCLYQASDTGLLDFLIKAGKEENKNELFIAVFDEMNLAQIEYWFAPFISIMEEKSENQRLLRLYGDNLNCINNFLYPPTIKIGNNVRFIGTINLDETSKDISDRVLDRANLIKLEKLDFLECKKLLENKDKNFINSYHIDYEIFSDWINIEIPFKKMSELELKFFDKLHNHIFKYDSQKGVSFRVLEQIGNYLNNIPESSNKGELISKKEAIDIQVYQRVLSKLKGSSEVLGDLLGQYNMNSGEVENSILMDLFDSTETKLISNFEKSKKEILRKAKEISLYGYTN